MLLQQNLVPVKQKTSQLLIMRQAENVKHTRHVHNNIIKERLITSKWRITNKPDIKNNLALLYTRTLMTGQENQVQTKTMM